MNEQNAPADLRYLIRATRTGFGDPNSLANVNTTELPDGAMCYVIADRALWSLNKGSTAAGVAGAVLTPGSGPGRWFYQGASESQAPPAQMLGVGSNTYAADGNWGIASTSNFSLLSLLEPSLWAITALGGILTYTGAPRTFLAQANIVAQVTNADAARLLFAVISHNNDFVGVAAIASMATAQTIVGAAVPQQINANRVLQLATGDTVRVKLAGPAAATAITTTQVSLAIG
jgi:hypothetical protein